MNNYSQEVSFKDINEDALVGFQCGGGPNTTIVGMFSEILEKKEYETIVNFLYSKKEGERLLAALVCEKLAKEKIIELTTENKITIKSIHRSKESITVCAGCSYLKKTTTKDILKESNALKSFFEMWIEKYL